MQVHDEVTRLMRRPLCFGWWLVLDFLTLGLGLESLHGLKVSWYLDVEHILLTAHAARGSA